MKTEQHRLSADKLRKFILHCRLKLKQQCTFPERQYYRFQLARYEVELKNKPRKHRGFL